MFISGERKKIIIKIRYSVPDPLGTRIRIHYFPKMDQRSGSIWFLFLEPDPDPLFPNVDPRIWIKIHVKMKWICNTAWNLSQIPLVHEWYLYKNRFSKLSVLRIISDALQTFSHQINTRKLCQANHNFIAQWFKKFKYTFNGKIKLESELPRVCVILKWTVSLK